MKTDIREYPGEFKWDKSKMTRDESLMWEFWNQIGEIEEAKNLARKYEIRKP